MKKLLFYFISITIIIFSETLFSIPHSGMLLQVFFIVFVGLHRGASAGCSVGFFIGLIEGVFSATSFGVSAFSYSIIGYLAGRVPKRIDEENPLAQIIIIFIGVALARAINIIVEMLFMGNRGSFYFGSGLTIVFVILTPLFFRVFKFWWGIWFKHLDVERLSKGR